MYSNLKNVQILIALLKKYNIKHLVIAPGGRHTPFVHSVESDAFFKTYSVVDERSASFFALGMIQKLREPVAVVCSSGTVGANFVSAASEAFYQQLPLLLLTADRNHYYMFQQEEQMIPQEDLFRSVSKRVVTLPHVRDDKDFWYCSRICNEALMELRHGEDGPVHINFIIENDYPVYQGIVRFEQKELPDVRKTERLTLESSDEEWQRWSNKLKKSKTLIIYGQHAPLTPAELETIEAFSEKYNVVFSTDMLSNLRSKYTIATYAVCPVLNAEKMESLCPDIVITMNGNTISGIKNKLMPLTDKFGHWHVSAKGEVSDPFKCLPDVVECSPQMFFEKLSRITDGEVEHSYYDMWHQQWLKIGKDGDLNEKEVAFSSLYAAQQYVKNIPADSLLHLANSNSVRIANYFTLKEGVEVYCNRGTNGIDGSMSSFVGQASCTDGPCYLLIGDLSFFYDMNALWNSYIGKNIRILVCNNSGGAIFHTYPSITNVPTLDRHIAAEHHTSAKSWVESRGFKYLCATNKAELDLAIQALTAPVSDSQGPMLLEVFTDKEKDAQAIKSISGVPQKRFKRAVGKVMPKWLKVRLKKIIK